MSYIPEGLPGDLNFMLLLEDTNLKQECEEIVQNGTMDCVNVKKTVAKLRDKIQYLGREYKERNGIFLIRRDIVKEKDYSVQSTQKWINFLDGPIIGS